MNTIFHATLRLFNAIQIDKKTKKKQTEELLSRTIAHGYLLQPTIPITKEILSAVEDVIGISGEKANAAFHKSWHKVATASIEQLVIEQILHYITTYGFESLGIYDKDLVYMPLEEVSFSDISHMPLTVIKALTKEEILTKIVESFGSGIALSQETLDDIMTVIKINKYDSHFVKDIQNRELKSLLYDYYNLVPDDPIEYLRFIITKVTGESLLIKNKYMISKILEKQGNTLTTLMLDGYLKKAPLSLGSIFLRYKPLFLALKKVSNNKTFFNNLRRQAIHQHRPLPIDYFNDITAQIKNKTLDLSKFKDGLRFLSVFRKIRLAYALKYRLNPSDSIVYIVRNGRGWTTDFSWKNRKELTKRAYFTVLASLVDDIYPNVNGKTIYIPPFMHYALPATEKQFMGNFPIGSYVVVPEDLLVGIHWENKEDDNGSSYRSSHSSYRSSVDLDLSMLSLTQKIGWDGHYRNNERSVLFSGDVTNAPLPHGASELFYMKRVHTDPFVMYLNIYRGRTDIPCKFLIGCEKVKNLKRNYMINPENILASAQVKLTEKQNILGIVVPGKEDHRVYFCNVSIGKSITSGYSPTTTKTREYYLARFTNPIDFNSLLAVAGAEIITEKPIDDTEYIDLSPEALDKTTILDLVRSQ